MTDGVPIEETVLTLLGQTDPEARVGPKNYYIHMCVCVCVQWPAPFDFAAARSTHARETLPRVRENLQGPVYAQQIDAEEGGQSNEAYILTWGI